MKIRTILASLLLAMLGLQASADTNRYLIFTMSDGVEVSYQLEGLNLAFAGTTLNITAADTKVSYATSELRNMFFSATPDAVSAAQNSQATLVSVGNGKLTIAAPAGTKASVYDAQGRLVLTTTIQGASAVLNTPRPGIYTVRAGSQTVKVLSK